VIASKVNRVIPLAVSGMVLIRFLINIEWFGLDFNLHFQYGAGVIFHELGGGFAPLFARIFLHISLFALFVGGILLFVRLKKFSKANLLLLSTVMLILFLIRPVVSVINYFIVCGWRDKESGCLAIDVAPTFIFQLTGITSSDLPRSFLSHLATYSIGIVLLLLLTVNLVLSFFHKQDPVRAHQRQNRVTQPRYVQPMPVQPQGASTSMTQELERLQQMYNSGALTEEEFTVAKKRVLGN
jgi:hypothetical protein